MILDTNAVSALADGDASLSSVVRNVTMFSLPVIVIGEFCFGIARSRHHARYASWLDELVRVSSVLVVDQETALHYATVREMRRAQGRPIPSNDTWIAALSVQHNLPVLTRDEHFEGLDGVRRITW